MTALHHAVLTGNAELVRVLLDSGSEVDVIDKRGLRPLHYAAWKGDFTLVELLCRHGNGATAATVNPRSTDGYTPLHVAAEHGHHAVVERLLRWGADPLRVNDRGRTPLDVACEFGRTLVVDLLTNWIPASRLIAVDKHQTTCLHLASRNGHIDPIRILLRAGVDINKQTLRGTCLHEAAMFGKAEVVRYLLSHGADVNRVNSYEQTALDIVSKFTANRAAHQIEQMLRDTGTTTSGKSTHLLRSTMPFSQTCSDLPVSRDLDTANHERRLSGNFSDSCVRLSESSPSVSSGRATRVDIKDGKHTGCTELNSRRNDVIEAPSDSGITSQSPESSRSSLNSASLDSLSQMDGTVDQAYLRQEDTSKEAVQSWLASLQLAEYAHLFVEAGYDLPTITRMTPEDLTAIGVTKPSVRKRLKFEIGRLETRDPAPDFHPASVKNLLHLLNLDEYQETLSQQGYQTIDTLLDITWEDLEEIGIRKLGHQKKMMLVVDRLKRLNRCGRSATPNGFSGTLPLRRTMSAASDYSTGSPSSRVTVMRTHSGLSDSRHARGHARPSNVDPYKLKSSSPSPSAIISYRTPSNSCRSIVVDESRNNANGGTSRPSSRQKTSKESTSSSFTPTSSVSRATPPLTLTTAATMPDIIGRTRSNGDPPASPATASPSSVSDRTPTNEWKTQHQAPLFAAYCSRQKQLESSSSATTASHSPTGQNRFIQLGPQRIAIDSVGVCRPSAKVLPSPKAPSSGGESSWENMQAKTPVEGVPNQNGKTPISAAPGGFFATFGTLPRRKVLPTVKQRVDENVDQLDRSSKKQPEPDVGGTGYPLLSATVKSSSDNGYGELGQVRANGNVFPLMSSSSSVGKDSPPKPTPPKRTNSVRTETTKSILRSGEHHPPTPDADKDRRLRAVYGVRRHDSGSSADRQSRSGEPVLMTSRPGSWPDNILANGVHLNAERQEVLGESRPEMMSKCRSDKTSASVTSSATSSSSPGSLPRTAVQRVSNGDSDPAVEGVMPFANEDAGTIKLHRIAVVRASACAGSGVMRHVTWQQSNSPCHLRHNEDSLCVNNGLTNVEDRSIEGNDCSACSTHGVSSHHDDGDASEAASSSLLLKDIDGMLNGLAAELDIMLNMHS